MVMAFSFNFKTFWLPIMLCMVLDAKSLGNSYLYRVNPETDFYDQLQDFIEEREFQNELAKKNWPTSIKEVDFWPVTKLDKKILQVTGVDVSPNGQVYIFHRGARVWDEKSFDSNNLYKQKSDGPIKDDTILVYNATGELVRTWGGNKFYMPHGITIDNEGNTWITDVALHQVFKFEPGSDKPSMILGEAFVPGPDNDHFCKPTDVAVASNGKFFVSDGYCNSRILMYKPDGQLELVFGTKDWLTVPHGMTLDERNDRLCVADRENYRVVCYSAGINNRRSGVKLFTIPKPKMGRVFGIVNAEEHLFAITGFGDGDETPSNALLHLNLDKKQLVKTWRPSQTEFLMPHDIAMDSDRTHLYIVDGDAKAFKKIYKLKLA